jgi:hypothetical protein
MYVYIGVTIKHIKRQERKKTIKTERQQNAKKRRKKKQLDELFQNNFFV